MPDTIVSCFPDQTARLRRRIDAALRRYAEFPPDCPSELAAAIRYSLLAPGKRLRPMLVLMAAEACADQTGAGQEGGELDREANGDGCGDLVDRAMPAACAVEMIHAYSLVHDDLPAMDDDDLRRGRPTCHKQFGEALAILAGDALLTLAFEVLARDVRPAELAARCCAQLAQAAGAIGLVGGQADDLACERERGEREGGDLAALEAIHRRKTGALFRVSLRLGAMLADAGAVQRAAQLAVQIAALDEYGARLGLAFQIVDDLLDVAGSESELGKRAGKDAGRGKLTFPGLLGVAESRRRAEQLVDEACAVLASFPGPTGMPQPPAALVSLVRYVLERNR